MFHMRILFSNGNVSPYPPMEKLSDLEAWVEEECERLSKKNIPHEPQYWDMGTKCWVDKASWLEFFSHKP